MLEIELKFRVGDFAAIERILNAWQARADSALEEADHYFNGPDRDFARTDEAFRLRRIGSRNLITYKGPKQPGPAKTRLEIEVPLESDDQTAEEFCRLVQKLGYRPTAIVRKRRTTRHFSRGGFDLQACFDEVDKIGRFVEVEIVAAPEARAQAEKVLQEVAAELGLHDLERRSYLEMTLAAEQKM